MSKLNANDKATWIKTIWDALDDHRETCDLLNAPIDWDDICTAMAWIAEDMEVDSDE
jgi:hypothetical protein